VSDLNIWVGEGGGTDVKRWIGDAHGENFLLNELKENNLGMARVLFDP